MPIHNPKEKAKAKRKQGKKVTVKKPAKKRRVRGK